MDSGSLHNPELRVVSLQRSPGTPRVEPRRAETPEPTQQVDRSAPTTPSGGNLPAGGPPTAAEFAASLSSQVERLNEISVVKDLGISFELNEAVELPVIEVVDRETEETLRQIPPEELVRVAEKLQELVEDLQALAGFSAAGADTRLAGNLLNEQV